MFVAALIVSIALATALAVSAARKLTHAPDVVAGYARAGVPAARLNPGNYEPLLRMYANDAELVFPGDNFLSRQFRSPHAGRSASPTHRGKAELEAFLRRCVELGLQFQVEDILVNGPPWKTRVCLRDHHWIPNDSDDAYANRAAICVEVAWGKIKHEEIYQDTQRTTAYEHKFGPFEQAPR